jgi:hypothetical protein
MASCKWHYSQFRPELPTLAYFCSWRRMRRASHEALSKVAVPRYHPILTKEATILASALLSNPENRGQHIQRTTASTIMSILYDHPTLASGQDKAVQDIDRNIHHSARALMGMSFVEFFPWMMHIPQRFSGFCTISILPSHLKNRQVCEVEEGSLEASCPAFRDVSRTI